MKVSHIGLLLISIMLSTVSKGQETIKPLNIGDKVPDIVFRDGINLPENISRLSDLKGKLVIFDYWNKWCSFCIANFPKFENIQQEFNGQIQVILVTNNNYSELQELKKMSSNVNNTKLPMIVGDSTIKKLFPHKAVPFIIWIDKQGIVLAKTNYHNVTNEHIKNILAGNVVNMALRDDNSYQDTKTSLLDAAKGEIVKHSTYNSITTGSIAGVDMREIAIEDSLGTSLRGVRILNYSFLELFARAYLIDDVNLINLKVSRLKEFLKPSDNNKVDEWNINGRFCYEIQTTPQFYSYDTLKTYMQKDLNRYFKTFSEKKKEILRCLVLTNIGISKDIQTKFENGIQVAEKTTTGYNLKYSFLNGMISLMKGDLLSQLGKMPILNEANYNGRIDLEIDLKTRTLEEINKSLEKVGLKFIVVERELETLTINDENSISIRR